MPLFESYSQPIFSNNSGLSYNYAVNSSNNNDTNDFENTLFKTSMNHPAFDNFMFEEGLQSPLDSSRTLFVGDLSYFCTEEDLYALFSPFGNILTVRVRRGVTGESLMHGFVAMDTSEASRTAIDALDGKEYMGRIVRVQLSSDGQRNPFNKEALVQVHVSFISTQTVYLVTEKVLRDIFTPFGNIADVAIKKHASIPRQNRQSGYGFVYFHDVASAYRAQQTLKNSTIHDITLDCSISHKSESMIRQSRCGGGGGVPPMMPRAISYGGGMMSSMMMGGGGVATASRYGNNNPPQLGGYERSSSSNLPPHVFRAMAAAAANSAVPRGDYQQYFQQYSSNNPRMMAPQAYQQPQFLGEEQYFGGDRGSRYDLPQQPQPQASMPYHRAALSSGPYHHRSVPTASSLLVGQQFSNPYQQREDLEDAGMTALQRPLSSRVFAMEPADPPLSLGGSRDSSSLMVSFRNSGSTPPLGQQQQQLSSSPSTFPLMMHEQNSLLGGNHNNHSTSSEFFSEEGKTTIGNTGSGSASNTARGSGGVFSGGGLGLNTNSSSNSFAFVGGNNDSFSISPREFIHELAPPSASTLGSSSLLGLTSSSSGDEAVRCLQCGRYEMLQEPLEAALAAHHRCENCLNGNISSQADAWR